MINVEDDNTQFLHKDSPDFPRRTLIKPTNINGARSSLPSYSMFNGSQEHLKLSKETFQHKL